MSHPFTISRSRCAVVSDPALREEILAHTGSDIEVSAILRSLERFAGDASIQAYEITPQPRRLGYHDTRATAWSVRALRL